MNVPMNGQMPAAKYSVAPPSLSSQSTGAPRAGHAAISRSLPSTNRPSGPPRSDHRYLPVAGRHERADIARLRFFSGKPRHGVELLPAVRVAPGKLAGRVSGAEIAGKARKLVARAQKLAASSDAKAYTPRLTAVANEATAIVNQVVDLMTGGGA
jgi:hypothetical protein